MEKIKSNHWHYHFVDGGVALEWRHLNCFLIIGSLMNLGLRGLRPLRPQDTWCIKALKLLQKIFIACVKETNNNGNDTGNGIAMVVSCFTTGVHSPNGVTRNLSSGVSCVPHFTKSSAFQANLLAAVFGENHHNYHVNYYCFHSPLVFYAFHISQLSFCTKSSTFQPICLPYYNDQCVTTCHDYHHTFNYYLTINYNFNY